MSSKVPDADERCDLSGSSFGVDGGQEALKLFLINRSEKEQRVSGELFGFNTGKFEEKVKGWTGVCCFVAHGI